MRTIKEFIIETFWPSEQIIEMATISKVERWGNEQYRIATHGTAAGDRETPHVHIYLSNDTKPYNKFNFEISLIDILCYDEINLIYQRDKKANKLITNRNRCSWEGYNKILNGFEEWLFERSKMPGEFKDNLDAIIWCYNNESSSLSENPLLDYINERGLTILDKYKHYFNN